MLMYRHRLNDQSSTRGDTPYRSHRPFVILCCLLVLFTLGIGDSVPQQHVSAAAHSNNTANDCGLPSKFEAEGHVAYLESFVDTNPYATTCDIGGNKLIKWDMVAMPLLVTYTILATKTNALC